MKDASGMRTFRKRGIDYMLAIKYNITVIRADGVCFTCFTYLAGRIIVPS